MIDWRWKINCQSTVISIRNIENQMNDVIVEQNVSPV